MPTATVHRRSWARGLTAATDERIARNAAARRGQRRGPYKPRAAGKFGSRPGGVLGWTAEMAYAVGLIATDGCLGQGRRITFTSADRVLVKTFLACTGHSVKIGVDRRRGHRVYRAQIGDVQFYRWLASVGLTERKSLTLGAIDVPDEFLFPIVRGLLDGDGSIANKLWRADTKDRSDYFWEWLATRFVSGSRRHLEWLASRIDGLLGLRGYIGVHRSRKRPGVTFALRYGKPASVRLLALLYADRDAPALPRKRAIWERYRARHDL